MNTTLSPVTVQRFSALQGELITLVEQDYTGLTPKLEQIIRAFEFTQIELAVYRDRGYAQGRGVGQPESDRCALACAFIPGQGSPGMCKCADTPRITKLGHFNLVYQHKSNMP